MPTLEKARELAQAMVALGNDSGVNTRALLTNMDTPLGRAAGNWLEVKEAVACLDRRTSFQPVSSSSRTTSHEPAVPDTYDLRELVLACASHLLVQTSKDSS